MTKMTEEITKDIRVAFKDYMDKVDALAKENDELKQLNNQLLDDLYFEREQSKDFEIHFTRVDLENETLKSALEEIREICKQTCKECGHNKDDITCSYGECAEGKIFFIENKINEVLK